MMTLLKLAIMKSMLNVFHCLLENFTKNWASKNENMLCQKCLYFGKPKIMLISAKTNETCKIIHTTKYIVQTWEFLLVMYSFIVIYQKLVKKYFQLRNTKMLVKHQMASATFILHIGKTSDGISNIYPTCMAPRFAKFHCHSISNLEVLRVGHFCPPLLKIIYATPDILNKIGLSSNRDHKRHNKITNFSSQTTSIVQGNITECWREVYIYNITWIHQQKVTGKHVSCL